MTEAKAPEKRPFRNIGTIELSHSGQSYKIQVSPEYTVFDKVFYISRESLEKLVAGNKQFATVFQKEDDDDDERGLKP